MRGFYRRFDRIVDLCGDVPGYLVALIAAVIFLDVASRNLGFGALGGVLEMVQYALVLLAFTGAVHVFRERRHIRVEVLVAMLPRRLRRGVELDRAPRRARGRARHDRGGDAGGGAGLERRLRDPPLPFRALSGSRSPSWRSASPC